MESQAARLAALPPPVLPGAVVPPSREGWRQRPPDAAMDALHGWLSSAAMTRLLNLRIGKHRKYSDAAFQPSNVWSATNAPLAVNVAVEQLLRFCTSELSLLCLDRMAFSPLFTCLDSSCAPGSLHARDPETQRPTYMARTGR